MRKMKKRIFCAAIAAVLVLAAFPKEAQAALKDKQIKLRSPYTNCMNRSSSDNYNYDKDSFDFATPYDCDTDKITKKTGTSLTIHWYPIYGASGYEVLNAKGKVV
ncbi:MAG TPA: hypothetical protein DCQ87_00425, partial [Lachnospiraceae bacterium]|nr:hypothetical protein [Lachnospiraceae bacterium]